MTGGNTFSAKGAAPRRHTSNRSVKLGGAGPRAVLRAFLKRRLANFYRAVLYNGQDSISPKLTGHRWQ
jgi:hypothetical protein